MHTLFVNRIMSFEDLGSSNPFYDQNWKPLHAIQIALQQTIYSRLHLMFQLHI